MDSYSFDHILYVGSIRVLTTQSCDDRLELIRQHMVKYRNFNRAKPISIIIAISGIKVCSPDGKVVHMAHALRRISYATCDLQYNQFCFLAREPKGHFSNQYCHLFVTKSSQQAEELNSIVGNAFRMAYTAQLSKQTSRRDDKKETNMDNRKNLDNIIWGKIIENRDEIGNLENLSGQQHRYRYAPGQQQYKPPNTIVGLHPTSSELNYNNSNESTPTSDESNSPTELNMYKRLLDKPPLVKRIPFVAATDNTRQHLYQLQINDKDQPAPSSVRPNPEGCLSIMQRESLPSACVIPSSSSMQHFNRFNTYNRRQMSETKLSTNSISTSVKSISDYSSSDSENFSQNTVSSQCCSPLLLTSESASPVALSNPPLPPPMPPEKEKEENELRSAPWFQAGIPREITLEVLSQEPIGAFMVRKSTTKPGCFALSVRVPREFHARGIAHYLILKTNKGYKIKGFTKEFSTLTALITHHSVMKELLPCPLFLSRYNPSFVKSDTNNDFADIDTDPDYNTLTNFRKMMADLNV